MHRSASFGSIFPTETEEEELAVAWAEEKSSKATV